MLHSTLSCSHNYWCTDDQKRTENNIEDPKFCHSFAIPRKIQLVECWNDATIQSCVVKTSVMNLWRKELNAHIVGQNSHVDFWVEFIQINKIACCRRKSTDWCAENLVLWAKLADWSKIMSSGLKRHLGSCGKFSCQFSKFFWIEVAKTFVNAQRIIQILKNNSWLLVFYIKNLRLRANSSWTTINRSVALRISAFSEPFHRKTRHMYC